MHFGAITVVAFAAWVAQEKRPRLECSLSATRNVYMLGEPVVLKGSLKNAGKEPIKEVRADLPWDNEAIDVFISNDGSKFRQYRMGIFPWTKVARPLQTLGPQEEWRFELRILYTFECPSRLAFERPGKYFIKVVYPLISRGGRHREVVESNAVALQVRTPEGVDAELWSRIGKPEFLYFLQSGMVQGEHPGVLGTAIEIVQSKPKSAYHDAIKWALKRYYGRQVEEIGAQRAQTNADLERIRQIVGIPKVLEGPFPDDKRLDVKVTYQFSEWTPMERVFEVISAAGGVRLRLAPELKIGPYSSLQNTTSVREFMRHLAGTYAVWVPQPDGGYRLVPTKVPEPPKPKGR